MRDPAARRYAQAAFELGRERNELEAWERDLASLAGALVLPEALAFVESPKTDTAAKEAFLQRVAGETAPLVWNLVRLLTSKRRLGLLPQIAERFQELLDEHRGVAHATVVTAVPLSDGERASLEKRLSELTSKQVDVKAFEEPDILGGLIARIGDRLIDGSTRSKLVALKRQLSGMAR